MSDIMQNMVAEWSFSTSREYKDPFNDVQFDVAFVGKNGTEIIVPGFWAGQNVWRVRFASPVPGTFKYRTICSDKSNSDLHGLEKEFEVLPYKGENPLYGHGPLRISPDRTHFQHLDGTPFFWLADTWWMGLEKRLEWPGDFHSLTSDRVEKGFNVIQIVAGLYPDMPPFDERGANEGGFPWEQDYQRINPAYFDMADRRIQHLVESGLVPCIVGCWGYFLDFMGVEKIKQHWRYLIARYGAYPVVWCAAGEALMPYYLHPLFKNRSHPEYELPIKRGWTEVTQFLRSTDPYHRLITIHPTQREGLSRSQLDDGSLLDFDMIQAGAGGQATFLNAIKVLKQGLEIQPKMPCFPGELVYESAGGTNGADIQRQCFWATVLSGAKGYTYGANGIWQLNRKDLPHGASPHGTGYGSISWDEAAKLPGSAQLGLAKKFLEQYPWQQFEPHQEWIEFDDPPDIYTEQAGAYFVPYAAGIPGKVRLVFFNTAWCPGTLATLTKVKCLEPDLQYRAFLFDPSSGEQHSLGDVVGDEKGQWLLPEHLPVFRDWVLVMEAKGDLQ